MWLAYLVGAGIAASGQHDTEANIGLSAEAAIAAHDEHHAVGLGLRVRYALARDGAIADDISRATYWRAHVHTVDVAVTLDVGSEGWNLQPWLGVHVARGTVLEYHSDMDPTQPVPPSTTSDASPPLRVALGAMVARDVARFGPHHIAAYLEVETTLGSATPTTTRMPRFGDTYTAIAFGVAYRI